MDLLKKINNTLIDAKASNINIYTTSKITPFYDYIINVTANSSRQLNAIVNHLRKLSIEINYDILGVEGLSGGFWALVDFNSVLINIFIEDERLNYDLDKLWKDLPQVDSSSLT